MLKKIAVVVGVLVVGILAMAFTAPDSFRVERSMDIQAPPQKVFALIDDFHAWGSWSPWEKLDPAMKRTYSGADAGKGAAYAWDGTKAGAGRMEILDAVPGSKVTIRLDFIKPMEGHNTAEFTMAPQGNTTRVTWAMFGPNPFVAKVLHLFFSMDKVIGKDFEAGLSNMKALAEK